MGEEAGLCIVIRRSLPIGTSKQERGLMAPFLLAFIVLYMPVVGLACKPCGSLSESVGRGWG